MRVATHYATNNALMPSSFITFNIVDIIVTPQSIYIGISINYK